MASKRPGRPAYLTELAKKRLRRERSRAKSVTRIYLGDQYVRWMAKKRELDETHEGLAKILLDRLSADSESESAEWACAPDFKVSTPSRQIERPFHLSLPSVDVSEISSAFSENTDTEVSHKTNQNRILLPAVTEESLGPSHRRKKFPAVKETSFLNPFEVTIEVSEECSSDIDSDDDYEPSFNVTLKPNNMDNLKEVTLEEQEFGEEECDTEVENESEEMRDDTGPGVIKLTNTEDIKILTEDFTCLVYRRCLLKLASTNVNKICSVEGCNSAITLRTENIGSALYIYWECEQKHEVYRWCSQPVLNRHLHGGDLQIASALLCSGNNFSKMALYAKFLRLYFPGKVKFSNIQRTYLVPTINSFWMESQRQVVESVSGRSVVALGDGRNDSPGHSAQYCTYTIMDDQSKKIISLITMDKRETGKKSCNMEKACFMKSMNDLLENHVNIEEVVTDAHIQIGAVMKNIFPNIKHSHDVWHAAKNLGKKVIKAGQSKECRELLDWNTDIINHFWFSCCSATDLDNFMEIWCGIVHHVVNEHTWDISYSSNFFGACQCKHGPLQVDHKEWMKKGSPPHKALVQIVFSKRFLKAIPYYLNFRSTAELENFNNLILMCSGKRFAYSPPVYRARNQLAALDYNANVDREVKRKMDGTVQQHRTFNKKSGRWSVSPVKVYKNYDHIHILQERIVEARLNDQQGMSHSVLLDADDPRRLGRTIAPTDPRPTAELQQEKISRFQTKT